MSQFYEIDSTRISHKEMLWWHSRSPTVVLSWLPKWLRIRNPVSSDDPNTASTYPFVVGDFPPDIAAGLHPLMTELSSFGFVDPMGHIIHDPGTQTTWYWMTFRHESEQHFARIHQRVWQRSAKPNRGTFPMFFTESVNGTFLVSSSGKPDMDTPASVRMNRMPKAKAPTLWESHQRRVTELGLTSTIVPVRSREDAAMATERHHVLVRDFHIARKVFRPRTATEAAKADGETMRIERARAVGFTHPEVMAEVEKLQEQKPGWIKGIFLLLISLAAFIAAGRATWNWSFTLWLIPVLLIHESGHWVAMRVFKYRNMRMFFIPFFGAAVSGQNWNVPGWKKALVSLAGPLPGIAIGVVLTGIGLALHKPWIDKAALLFLILNGFNLLPFLPLDGGHVLRAVLFCRNRWLDLAFRIVAIAGLIGLSMIGKGKTLVYVAIVMAASLPVAFKIAGVTDKLRHEPLRPPEPDEPLIPVETAERIITEVKSALPKKVSNKSLALHTVNIFETLNAHPPNALATIGLLILHAGSFLTAVVFCLVLVVGMNGSLRGLARAAATQPRYAFDPLSVHTWKGGEFQNETPGKTILVATFPKPADANEAFSGLAGRLPSDAAELEFGQSLMVSLPPDDALREKWFDQMQGLTTNVFVAISNQAVAVTIMALAPDAEAGTNLNRELSEYFAMSQEMHLIPPWAPQARFAEYTAAQRERHAWRRIDKELGGIWKDPALQAYPDKIAALNKRGAATEAKKLVDEQAVLSKQLEAKVYDRLQTGPDAIDAELVNLHRELRSLDYTNRTARAVVLQKLAGKLGGVKYEAGLPDSQEDAYRAISGYPTHQGLIMHVSWAMFSDPTVGLPAFTRWLGSKNCIGIRYEFGGAFDLSDHADPDD